MTAPPALPDLDSIPEEQREVLRQAAREVLAIRSLAIFVQEGWHVLEPGTDLVWNWHHDLICRKLEAVSRGEIRELVICIPPRCLKSKLVSVLWHAWRWLHAPGEQRLSFASKPDLASRDSRHTRKVINSPWYQRLQKRKAYMDMLEAHQRAKAAGEKPDDIGGDPIWQLVGDQNQKMYFETDAGGHRISMGVFEQPIGLGGHGIIVDDPLDPKTSLLGTPTQVRERMEEVNTLYDESWRWRLNDQRTGWRVIIMQRLHERDLAGHRIASGAEYIVLPMEYDPAHPLCCPEDPRTELGELLDPVRYPREVVDSIKNDPRLRLTWLAQFQQYPTSVTGKLFKRAKMRHYSETPYQMADNCDTVGISVDASFKDKATSSDCSLLVWGRKGAIKVLIDRRAGKMDIVEVIRVILELCRRWPQVKFVMVEDKANGPAIIRLMRDTIPGITPFPAEDDPEEKRLAASSKYARAQVAAYSFDADQVLLPDPEMYPWVQDYIENMVAFPDGALDDDVDATSQMVIRWDQTEDEDPLDVLNRQLAALGM